MRVSSLSGGAFVLVHVLRRGRLQIHSTIRAKFLLRRNSGDATSCFLVRVTNPERSDKGSRFEAARGPPSEMKDTMRGAAREERGNLSSILYTARGERRVRSSLAFVYLHLDQSQRNLF